jgi:hypothetical protein
MNVDSIAMAKACAKFFRRMNGKYNDPIHISYSVVSVDNRSIYTISTDYNWHLSYWEHDLNQTVSKRLSPGISFWQDKGAEHLALLSLHHISHKVDYTWISPQSHQVEIISLAGHHPLSSRETHQLASIRPLLAYEAHQLWQKNNVDALPYEPDILPLIPPDDFAEEPSHFRFGDITLTKREMSTIRQLLAFHSVKVIAWQHRCSESAEIKRIETIKKKIGCSGNRAVFFQLLRQYGITEACLDVYTTSL